MTEPLLTPKQVAQRLGVGLTKVRGWIARGQLVAIDTASETGPGRRRRYRIAPAALAAFETQRSNGTVPAPAAATRPRKPAKQAEEFV
jgi:excisionase family DNA binding protein